MRKGLMNPIVCKPITTELLDDYLDFFDHRAFTDNPRWASCYCNFPLHDPSRKAWKLHSAHDNRSAVSHTIAAGRARGFLAYSGGLAIGWCNAGPWSYYPMLRESSEFETKSLGVIFCFIIEPRWRRRGVATALLAAACDGLRDLGLSAVQATPLKSGQDAAANHLGPLSMYLAAEFQVVRHVEDGTVIVRKELHGYHPNQPLPSSPR